MILALNSDRLLTRDQSGYNNKRELQWSVVKCGKPSVVNPLAFAIACAQPKQQFTYNKRELQGSVVNCGEPQ